MSVRRRQWFAVLGGLLLLVVVVGLVRVWPRPPLSDGVPQSRMVLSAEGVLLRMTLADDGQYRRWVPLSAVSPSMVDALLLKEDRAFHLHPGVDPVALVRAAVRTYSGGRRQGGSTLTMQLARRVYGIDSRGIPGKLRQLVMAVWLEARYSKQDILEAYLNLAPMGGNVEGVEAASRLYFGKSAAQLALGEALALAVIPQHPNARGSFGPALHEARAVLLRQWREAHPGDARDAAALDLPVQAARRQDVPFRAPHATQYLLSRQVGAVVRSTVSWPVQQVLERQVAAFVRAHRGTGVRNAAAVLVDVRDQSVQAWVGSADFFSQAISGQVDGVRAYRSPGSTLKPFLYALALDAGLIHPASMLKDAPATFGDFLPENHDGRFVGPLTAQQALVRSRNIPAVALAQRLPQPGLHGLLQQAGVAHLKPPQHYGLALALGAGEVSMEDLARLYLALAADGRVRPLRLSQDAPHAEGEPLFSTQAAYIVRAMLRTHPRPDGLPPDGRGGNWRAAWKTGTSWGYRDAWSAGVVGPYVLVVWVGNFDGRANPAFVGQQTAAPLFFQIADALRIAQPHRADPPDPPPPGVRSIAVCRASGDLPNRWCPETRSTWFIPGVSPIRVSSLHRPVWVDTRSGLATCPPFDAGHVRQEIHEFWPSDLLALFRQAGLPRRLPPAREPRCQGDMDAVQGMPPRVLSPSDNGAYSLSLSRPQQGLLLEAAVDSDVARLFWFAGPALIGETRPGEALSWRPGHAGRHVVRVSDDRGRSALQAVTVAFVP